MKRLLLLFAIVLCFSGRAHGQTNIQSGPTNPTFCQPGALFYNTTSNTQQQCGPANTWGSGGGISSNSPVPANQAQGPRYNPVNYANGLTINDAKKTVAAVTTNGSHTITDTTNSPWVAVDNNKNIWCVNITLGSALTPTMTTITAVNSSSSITVAATGNANAGAGTSCIWFSNKATAAFKAANVAACGGFTTCIVPQTRQGSTALTFPGAVTCPDGGYVVDGNFFDNEPTQANTYSVSFIGAGVAQCRIYLSPDAAPSNGGFPMYNSQTYGQTISGFTIDCSSYPFAFNAGTAFITLLSVQQFAMKDIELDFCGSSNSGQMINMQSVSVGYIDGVRINSTSFNSAMTSLLIQASSFGLHFRNFYETNPGPVPLLISSSGGKTSGGAEIIFEGGVLDEGGNPGAIQLVGSNANFSGVTAFAGTTDVLDIDGTSVAVVNGGSNFEPFGGSCGGGNRNAIKLAAGGIAYVGNAVLAGCGGATGPAVSGPLTAHFYDLGGNILRNCPAGCPTVAAATYTSAFGGGIIPQASIQMPSNTVYAVQGNLLATAQNLAQILLPVNQILQNVTAQSGGTTPANSSCATPPVITFSDGTRSATMTMTSGKTLWRSDVDASTSSPAGLAGGSNINQIFATGSIVTISIGANTCATPPVNVSVTYNLESGLNP